VDSEYADIVPVRPGTRLTIPVMICKECREESKGQKINVVGLRALLINSTKTPIY
jgi:hypothetical protein